MLLSVEEFRLLASSSLGDEALQLLLDAAEQAITARYGELGSAVVETYDGGQTYLFLRQRADEVTSITETVGTTETELDADDYRIRHDGLSILRLATGTNARSRWGGPVTVSYHPVDDTEERKRVQAELVKLDQDHQPGITSEQVGSWMVQRQQSSVWNYQAERDAILDSLATAAMSPGFA